MNIFEGVKFRDKFRTRDDKLAVYLSTGHYGSEDDENNPPFVIVYCAVEYHIKYKDGSEKYFHNVEKYDENGKWNKWNPENDDLDIVGKWEESSDDEKLNKLAEEYEGHINWEYDPDYARYSSEQLINAYKAGYRDAKEG